MNVLDAPPQIQRLPRDADGTPVPWGIRWTGIAEERRPRWDEIDQQSLDRALAGLRCFTCGERMMLHSHSFVLTMRGALLRQSPFPPSHATCASYIARRPLARIGPLAVVVPDTVVAVWQCHNFAAETDRIAKRQVYAPGAPNDVYWIKNGAAARRAEVAAELEAVDLECYPKTGLDAKVRYEDRRRVLKRWLPDD